MGTLNALVSKYTLLVHWVKPSLPKLQRQGPMLPNGPPCFGSVVQELALSGTRLQVGAQLVHAVDRIQKELPYGVDLHQSQVVQLQSETRNMLRSPNTSKKRGHTVLPVSGSF